MSATTTNERLAALTTAGTSVWLDQLSRGLIESGELKRMVEHESLRAVTSNPTILEKAILGSSDDDDDLRRPSEQGKSAREICRAMALHDVRAAADALRPVYNATYGLEGCVSWELAPHLPHGTEGTFEQAHMYWELVDRPT
jgi:transaldolase